VLTIIIHLFDLKSFPDKILFQLPKRMELGRMALGLMFWRPDSTSQAEARLEVEYTKVTAREKWLLSQPHFSRAPC
jgi:hypothetical protein